MSGKGDFDQPRIEAAVREILLAIGEDPDREGLQRTPHRIAEAYAELWVKARSSISKQHSTRGTRRWSSCAISPLPRSASIICCRSRGSPTSVISRAVASSG